MLAPGLLPARVDLDRMPFAGHTGPGHEYRTLLVEPPVLLPRLEADLRGRGVTFVRRHFADAADVFAAVPEEVVVDCTGLGAGALWQDPQVVPVRGHLAMLPAQPALDYLYGGNGYLFPRTDHVVIGGTVDWGVDDETPDPVRCAGLVRYLAGLFGVTAPVPLPADHVAHPGNASIVRADRSAESR
jgi:hypothetical protein